MVGNEFPQNGKEFPLILNFITRVPYEGLPNWLKALTLSGKDPSENGMACVLLTKNAMDAQIS
jgi:hypothetical protein